MTHRSTSPGKLVLDPAKSRHGLRFCALLLLICLLLAPAATAQLMRGTVVDNSGAAVSNAQLVATSAGRTVTTTADAMGRFSLPSLGSGSVELVVSAAGFETRRLSVPYSTTEFQVVLRIAPASEQIVVTPDRTGLARADTSATVSVLENQDLSSAAATTLDAKLQQVAGFTLFRRSDSRAINPTSEGVSLRGIGSSGASRTLITLDGVPLNDPFGGWVYFDRVPQIAVERIEVLQGGASELYGSGAMGGVIDILPRTPEAALASIDLSGGNLGTLTGSAIVGTKWRKWTGSAAVEGFRDDGYIEVSPAQRGAVDVPANLRYGSGNFRVGRSVGAGRAFGEFDLLDDARSNGTPDQFNDLRLWSLSGGLDLPVRAGLLTLRGYGDAQSYNQTFSSIAADRNTETFLRTQHVPAQIAGTNAQLTQPFGKHTLILGGEFHQITGDSNEIAFSRLLPTTQTITGGHQRAFAAFAQDRVELGNRLQATIGIRFDRWNDFDALATTVPLRTLAATQHALPQRDDSAASPQAGLVYRASQHISLTASGYRAFRAPTLNELYRGFRLGNIQTNANALLRAERLTGAEGGADFYAGPLFVRANFFYAAITDPIANVTLVGTPSLITRQRQNLGRTSSTGFELQIEDRLARRIFLQAGYQFADSVVDAFAADPTLVGKRVPEVPRQQVTFSLRYAPAAWALSAQMRASGGQYDDDQNRFYLPAYATFDLFVSRSITHGFDLYGTVQNLFDEHYASGATPVFTFASPRTYRGGVRWTLPR